MKKISIFLVISLIISLFASCSPKGISKDEAKKLGKEIASYYLNEDYDTFLSLPMTTTVKQNLTKDLLKSSYDSIFQIGGEYQKIEYSNIEEKDNNYTLTYSIIFDEITYDLIIGLNPNGELSSFNIGSMRETNPKKTPENLVEEEVSFGKKPYIISGTLTLPKEREEKIPAVIIVHGSGSSNRDCLINLNTPYRDIAWELAGNGIAVLRYDKRSYTYPKQVSNEKNLTPYDETIDDVVYAYKLLEENENIDKENIYIIGHSFGGYLLPRIEKETNAKGYIALAASASRVEDLLIKQLKYLKDKGDTSITEESIASYEKIRDNIKSLTEENKDTFPIVSLMNVPASYWLMLKEYDPIKEAKKLSCPILYLQGDKDYQVDVSEFNKYKDALKGKANVSFVLINNVNHILNENCEFQTSQDYLKKGNVSKKVTNEIIKFVKENSK